MRLPGRMRAGLAALAALALWPALAWPQAHQHGVVRLQVAVDGAQMAIALDAPLDNLLGFERAPRNDAERRAAADLLARLRQGGLWFQADAAAGCSLAQATLDAPALGPGPAAPAGEHADLAARYDFRCAQPAQLKTLTVALFGAFARIRRIEVQLAGPQGQAKAVLTPQAQVLKLAR